LETGFGAGGFGVEVVSLDAGLQADKQKVTTIKHKMLHLVWRLITFLLLKARGWTRLWQWFC
jgi:hypothetical protein